MSLGPRTLTCAGEPSSVACVMERWTGETYDSAGNCGIDEVKVAIVYAEATQTGLKDLARRVTLRVSVSVPVTGNELSVTGEPSYV